MKRLLPLLLLLPLSSAAQSDSAILQKLRDEIMLRAKCYENLRTLTKKIGNRISGSQNAEKAVRWGLQAMKDAGADTAWLQPVWVPKWVRGKEWLKVKGTSGQYEPLRMLSLGNAAGSNGKVLEAPIVMVQTIDEFKALSHEQVAGKIVFFNYRFRQDLISTFAAYSDAIGYRGATPTMVSAKGGIAVIIRSLSSGEDDAPHTGATRYTDTVKKIPAVALGNYGADKLAAQCRAGKVTAQLMTSARMMDSVLSYNVIGEIHGSRLPKEYVVVGGHLDSWDVGEGASDDGAGCVQSIEVLRALKAAAIQPMRSVRAVLFMNEENGLRGGRAYADSAKAKGEKHVLAFESDAGGFAPRGISLGASEAQIEKIKGWKEYFTPLLADDIKSGGGGADVSPLQKLGVPVAELETDPQRYFDVHHTAQDVFEAVNHRELKIGAAVMATMVYLASMHGL